MNMPLSTFVVANDHACRTVAEIRMSRDAAVCSRREVAIMQHSTLTWLDTYALASTLYTSELLQANYLRTARSFAQREMAAIDAMHAELARVGRALGV